MSQGPDLLTTVLFSATSLALLILSVGVSTSDCNCSCASPLTHCCDAHIDLSMLICTLGIAVA